MNKTSQQTIAIALAILFLPMTLMAAWQQNPVQTPNKVPTNKTAQGSTLKPDSLQKSPIQIEVELEEIIEIRKKLGGGVAEQLKGLNLQLDPAKGEKTVDQEVPGFREILREQQQSFEAVARDLAEAAKSNPKTESQDSGSGKMQIPPGHKVIAIKVPPEDTMQGLMKSGDFVDVIASNKNGAETIAKRIKVFFVKADRVGLLLSEGLSEAISKAREIAQIRLALLGSEPPETGAAQNPSSSAHRLEPLRVPPTLASNRLRPDAGSLPLIAPGYGAIPTPSGRLQGSVQPAVNQTPCTRTRKAARMVEEAAAELEQSGQYQLADELRRNAQKIWESAR